MRFISFNFLGFFIFMFFLFSCQNEESIIGENFVANGEYIVENYSGNIPVFASFEIEDSVIAIGQKSLLGSYLDPILGQINAGFSFQIQLPNNDINFNAESIINIYLNIAYDQFYGDTLIPHENIQFDIHVSQLNENIVNSDTAYSNQTNFLSTPIGSFSKNLSDIKKSNKLQLDLTKYGFGLDQILNLSADDLADNESFLNAFNGFKLDVTPINSSNGGIMYFDTASDSTFLHIEYLTLENEVETINFEIGSQIKLNYFNHDYANNILSNDSSLVCIQSMGGYFARIEIPFLRSLNVQGYDAINDAVLTIPISNENGSFPLPETLLLYENEQELDNSNFIAGGNVNSIDNAYEFNITNYAQRVMNEEADTIFRLYTYSRSSNADRVILSNSNHNPIELKLLLIKNED